MTNKLQRIKLQLLQHRKLLLAMVPSIFLHLILVSGFNINLPEISSDMQMLEARLVNLAPPKASPSPVSPPKKTIAQKPTQQTNTPLEDKPAATTPELPAMHDAHAVDNLSAASLNMPPVSSVDANTLEPQYQFAPDPETVVYTHVEAELEVKRDSDPSAAGITKISFSIDKNKRYTIHSQTEGKGLVSLFFSTLLQKSEGTVTDAGLRPDFYSYQYGSNANKSQTANFDWEKGVLIMRNAKGESIVNLTDGTQDFLSFMYQFMFTPPLNNLQITMTNGKKLRTYDYSFQGEEIISSKFGELKTIHLLKSSDDEEKTELWLATEYQYLPVKIRKTEKNKTVIEQTLLNLSVN